MSERSVRKFKVHCEKISRRQKHEKVSKGNFADVPGGARGLAVGLHPLVHPYYMCVRSKDSDKAACMHRCVLDELRIYLEIAI